LNKLLIDISTLEKIDTKKMYETYDKWPEIARNQYESDFSGIDFDEFDHIVFAGMGGSGAIGDIFAAILSKTDIHVEVIKGYLLPKTVNEKTVVVVISISGNTEETLNVLQQTTVLKCKTIAFSDNGKMKKYCFDNKIEHRQIAMQHSPRASFPTFLFSILKILQPFLPIQNNDITNSILTLEKQREEISSSNLTKNNPALDLAQWIKYIPIIYYPWGLQSAAIRFKNSLQENSKMHAITEDIIEACHNGIVSWDKPSKIQPILIQGVDDYIKTKEREEILKKFFDIKNIEYKEIHSINGNILSKVINLIYLLDYSSIYKAVLSNIDPTPVIPIDFVKKKLRM
jgi:glucose/mannose-6-phosphate isomerase